VQCRRASVEFTNVPKGAPVPSIDLRGHPEVGGCQQTDTEHELDSVSATLIQSFPFGTTPPSKLAICSGVNGGLASVSSRWKARKRWEM